MSLCSLVTLGLAGDAELSFELLTFIEANGVRLKVPVDADFRFDDNSLLASFFEASEFGDPAA